MRRKTFNFDPIRSSKEIKRDSLESIAAKRDNEHRREGRKSERDRGELGGSREREKERGRRKGTR